jgi:large repetitive protein
MHWTPLSGAQFEDVFGPQGKSARSRVRQRRDERRAKAKPKVESLENRVTPAITAGVIASSLASTSDPNVTIGEVIRQRVVIQEDLSGTFDPTAFNVQALLPPGLQLLPGSVNIALVSNQGMASTLDPSGTGGLNVTGDDTNVSSITPTFLLPASAITTDPTTGAIFFNTGISSVNDADANDEFIVIEFNALVTNVPTNQAETPTNLTSNFHLFVGGTICDCLGTDTVTVAEPTITDLAKTAQVNAAGDTATYTLTFSNTGNSIAYDVRVVDNLPAGLTLIPGSVTVTGGTGLVDRSNSTTLDVTFDSVAVGGSVTISYQAAIPPSARNGQPIVNTANIDYTSLPGPYGTSPNPTGSDTPGASGSETGERNGSGGVNDYFDTAQATIGVQSALPNSISGFVFGDLDHSGDFSPGDALLPGAIITLVDANFNPVRDLNGNLVAPQTTGAPSRSRTCRTATTS